MGNIQIARGKYQELSNGILSFPNNTIMDLNNVMIIGPKLTKIKI